MKNDEEEDLEINYSLIFCLLKTIHFWRGKYIYIYKCMSLKIINYEEPRSRSENEKPFFSLNWTASLARI